MSFGRVKRAVWGREIAPNRRERATIAVLPITRASDGNEKSAVLHASPPECVFPHSLTYLYLIRRYVIVPRNRNFTR